jgi:ubiquinone biosynthesis protein
MSQQMGWRGLIERLKDEAPRYGQLLPQLPRLVHQALTVAAQPQSQNNELLKHLLAEQKRTNRLLSTVVYFGTGLVAGIILIQFLLRVYHY